MMTVAEQFNYRKNPYRGIFSEIARERGVKRQAVQKSFQNGNPIIVEAVAKKIEQRKLMAQELEKLMNQDSDEKRDQEQSSGEDQQE